MRTSRDGDDPPSGVIRCLSRSDSSSSPPSSRSAEDRNWWFAVGGIAALAAYGFVATFQPDANFGRILAAYGGIFVAGSLLWGMVADGFRPDRFDIAGALVCLSGVGLIMYAPR